MRYTVRLLKKADEEGGARAIEKFIKCIRKRNQRTVQHGQVLQRRDKGRVLFDKAQLRFGGRFGGAEDPHQTELREYRLE